MASGPTTSGSPPARSVSSATRSPVSPLSPAAVLGASGVPRFQHVVVVVEENKSYGDVIGNASAPYLNSLATSGALFTDAHAVSHPSEPNYLALFSGSTQGLADDSCPHRYSTPNLGSELAAAGLSFAGYSESLPADGSTTCWAGEYGRKHNPWSDFPAVPSSSNRRFAEFPTDFDRLPTVSFVIPNLADDMHDGSIAAGDGWLRAHLAGYARWANTHHSLLVVTWDEDDNSSGNQIATVFAGQQVRSGRYARRIDHYSVLRTIEDAYRLSHAGASGSAAPITGTWR